MSGLILLAVLGLWGFICFWVVRFLLGKVKNPIVKNSIAIVLCGIFFLLPVADEIIGGFQFRALCSKDSEVFIDTENAKNKTVIYRSVGSRNFSDYLVPIVKENTSYFDSNTGDLIISWNIYRAKGGWLARSLNLMQTKTPYTFNGVCGPKNFNKSILSNFNITVLN